MITLQGSLEDAGKYLNEQKKDLGMVRSEMGKVEHKLQEYNAETMKEILEDIANYEKDFRQLQVGDFNEVHFLKEQVVQIQKEKTVI